MGYIIHYSRRKTFSIDERVATEEKNWKTKTKRRQNVRSVQWATSTLQLNHNKYIKKLVDFIPFSEHDLILNRNYF